MTSVALFSQLTGESDGEVHRPLHASGTSGEVVELTRVDCELLAHVVDQVGDRLKVQVLEGDVVAALRVGVVREQPERLEPVHESSLVGTLDLGEGDEKFAPLDLAEILLLGLSDLLLRDRKSTRLNSSHVAISYAVFCLKKKNQQQGF